MSKEIRNLWSAPETTGSYLDWCFMCPNMEQVSGICSSPQFKSVWSHPAPALPSWCCAVLFHTPASCWGSFPAVGLPLMLSLSVLKTRVLHPCLLIPSWVFITTIQCPMELWGTVFSQCSAPQDCIAQHQPSLWGKQNPPQLWSLQNDDWKWGRHKSVLRRLYMLALDY